MKKKVFSLMMMLLLAFTGFVRADELTVHDGTVTNSYVPVYGFYADAYLKCEMVYPASELSDMNGGEISAIKFYTSSPAEEAWTGTFQVFVKEVSEAAINAFAGPGTVVYEGTLDGTAAEMEITFNTPYQYNGGNLLVGVYLTTTGNYKSVSWTGETVSGASFQGYNYSSLTGVTGSQRNFLPKTTFTYTAGEGGDEPDEPTFEDNLHVKYVNAEGAEVIDTLDLGVRPAGAWMEPFTFTMYSEGPTYNVTVLDFTPSDGMFSVEGEELPFEVAPNADVELTMGTNSTAAGIIERQFVAITEGNRAAHIWPVRVELYTPECPDVVEVAYDLGTIEAGFSYEGIPSEITPTELHNDYTLPFPEIPEGVDGVYKFTVENDVILNAWVDSTAENGKVALYKQEGEVLPHPMADNNYQGLNDDGGSAAAPFEVQIGEGTSTFSYFPFYTLYNYSIAENLFLAAELEGAGVTTAPMTSLSWYATNTTGYAQQGITIWMANVDDAALTTTSHPVTNMTKVYTGTMTPLVGWNEFVFNEDSFAWDGSSNILIYCQRNNGAWNSTISWQATASMPFNASSYTYQDSGAYDATIANTMYTSTTRPNIIMKGGNRDRATLTYDFENSSMSGWTTIDADGDGYNWMLISEKIDTGYGHNGSVDGVLSQSYDNDYGVLYPDNYLVSPQVALGGSISFYACGQDAGFAAEHFGVFVSTTGTGNWTMVNEWTIAAKSKDGAKETIRGNRDQSAWTQYTADLSAYSGNGYVAIRHFNCSDEFYLDVDDITITTPSSTPDPTPTPGPTPGPTPTPGGGEALSISAGPVIENLGLTAGTYYLVASATQADYTVYINVDEMPCPAVEAEGFAFSPVPADNEDGLEPASVTLQWMVPEYATGWRLVFGSTYHPQVGHPQTIIYPEDGSWSTDMVNSYTVRNLWNNTNYFWHVEFNNGACPEGVSSPIWGFTTHLNIPQNLRASDETIFEGETVTLTWNAVVDRTYRYYFIYKDDVKIGETTVNQIGQTTYPVPASELAYNMNGYRFYVTAVYDEGESAPSNTVVVKVSGYSNETGINGYAYEQDGETPIEGVTVTITGTDEFGDEHTYTATTDENGYYHVQVYVGHYTMAVANKEGYQTTVTNHELPFDVALNGQVNDVNFIMDENFVAPAHVCAELVEVNGEELVKVWWDFDFYTALIEDFETGDLSKFDWVNSASYPWTVVTTSPYEGTYCLKSGGAGVANVVSDLSVTVDVPNDGKISFFVKPSCESSWDYGYFYIDGTQKGSFTGAGSWAEKKYDITAGEHTFKWQYTKDGSINANDDCIYVDYIQFNVLPDPPVVGNDYNFDNGLQGWTNIDADGDGYIWVSSADPGAYHNAGVDLTGLGHNDSEAFVISGSYSNASGMALHPDNYLVSPQVQLGGMVKFYAQAQDVNFAAEHFGLAVSTTSNTDASAFTTIQEWTMTAKNAGPKNGVRAVRAGEWYEYTVDLSAYSGMGYVAIRHFNCSDEFILNVDDITIGDPAKGGDRALNHYNIYRTDCYNDGPYNDTTTLFLATVWRPDTAYFDVSWPDAAPGVYKWGVSSVYAGNRVVDYPAEPRESDIVWSNMCDCGMGCIDKDMTIDSLVTVNVLLNSADSPEGAKVTFTNLNEGEQNNHPMDPVILDETGFYRFPSFRKGDYTVTVEHDGYETITDTPVSIWEPVDLRYVMIEILYGIDNLYVSRTGWAMWDAQGDAPTPVDPDDPQGETTLSESFESGMPTGWTTIDADGDGYNWNLGSIIMAGYLIPSHSGEDCVTSQSYASGTALHPDNYLVTPQVSIVNGSTFSFWACAQDPDYAAEHFGVAISTGSQNNAADFTTIQEWTMTAKGTGKAGNYAHRGREGREGNWYQYTVDLSAYAGQNAYIAIRHFNCSDMFYINVDDVELTAGAKAGDRHLEYFKVMCESIDHEPIFNANTTHNFCQVATDQLVEGEQYICKVAAVYSTGQGPWSEVVWQYESCENYAGTVDGVTVEGNTVSWTYPDGGEPTPPPTTGEWYYYGDDVQTTGVGASGPFYWAVMFPAGSYTGNQVTKVATYGAHDDTYGTNGAFTGTATIYNDGTTAPANAVGTMNITMPDTDQLVEFEFPAPVVIDPTKNLWVVFYNASSSDYVGSCCNDSGDPNGRWVSLDGTSWMDLATAGVPGYNWMLRAYVAGGAKGEVEVISYEPEHINSGVLSNNGVKVNNRADWTFANGFVTDPGAMANGADASWIKGSQGTWGPGCQQANGNRCADSFTLEVATTIDEITVYGYQTGSSTTSTFTGMYAQIFNGNPMSGGTAVWGDQTTNIMSSTAFTNCYRGSDGETTAMTRPIMGVTASGLNISLEAGTYYLVYSLDGTGSSGPWAVPHAEPGVGNTGNGVQYVSTGWQTLLDGGSSTPYGCAMSLHGTTGSGPDPQPGETNCIGAMIFVDGEWEAFVAAPTNTYTYEGEGENICVRMVYDGTAELPDNNFYYAMSCEECVETTPTCAAGAPIYAESLGETDQVKIWWGEQEPEPQPGEGDTFTVDFESGLPAGWTTIDADGDGNNWEDLGMEGHSGACISSQSYINYVGPLTPDNYLVSPAVTLGAGSTFSFWACAQDASYAAEHFGVAVSDDGVNFTTIQEWTIGAKEEVKGAVRSGRDQSAWTQYTVDLSNYAGEGRYIAIRHFNCTDQFYLNVDDIELANAAKNRDGIVKYNVYRSADNATYELIAEVPAVEGQTYYEYIDTPATGTYYYQVRADYGECESEPAVSGVNPDVNYVTAEVTGIDELNNVALYPNPTNSNVTIEAAGMRHITVVSVLGQVVYDAEVDNDQVILNMSQYNAGVYVVRVATANGVSTHRVTVVR